MQERLQKIIARAGIASRRKAEELIVEGRVRVNGRVVTELGTKADAAEDSIKVNGKRINAPGGQKLYLMLNKPKGYITSTADPEGRRTVMDLLGRYHSRVYPVGRLDYASEGLLLFTNDGDFANLVLSAKSAVPKVYQAKLNGNPSHQQQEQVRAGVKLNGRLTAPARVRHIKPGDNPWFEVVLTEGRNQQVRRMFRRVGFLVEKLKRVKIGRISLGKLPVGKLRALTDREVESLRKLTKPRESKAA